MHGHEEINVTIFGRYFLISFLTLYASEIPREVSVNSLIKIENPFSTINLDPKGT